MCPFNLQYISLQMQKRLDNRMKNYISPPLKCLCAAYIRQLFQMSMCWSYEVISSKCLCADHINQSIQDVYVLVISSNQCQMSMCWPYLTSTQNVYVLVISSNQLKMSMCWQSTQNVYVLAISSNQLSVYVLAILASRLNKSMCQSY